MTGKKKKSEELKDEELDAVTGGANETPIAASRFGISIDGVQIASATDEKNHEATHTLQQQGDKVIAGSGGNSDI